MTGHDSPTVASDTLPKSLDHLGGWAAEATPPRTVRPILRRAHLALAAACASARRVSGPSLAFRAAAPFRPNSLSTGPLTRFNVCAPSTRR
jgi:hypothetical protein